MMPQRRNRGSYGPCQYKLWGAGSVGQYHSGGYGVVHNNRYRAGLGVDWKVAKHHKLEFGALFDYRLDREVDTAWHSDDDDNSYLILKSFNIERSFAPILTVGYRYSF